MALTKEQQVKLEEYYKEISALTTKKFQLNREYAEVIKAYKKADLHGCSELPGWAVFLIGTPFYIAGVVGCIILRETFEFTNDILNYLAVGILIAMMIIGLPALIGFLVHYIFEDMLSDILKIPYIKEYRKYKKELREIEAKIGVLQWEKHKLVERSKPAKSSSSTSGNHLYTGDLYPPKTQPKYDVELVWVPDVSDM